MRAHRGSLIIVYVGVDQCCRARDEESPALPTMSTRNVPAGRWRKVQGKFKRKTHVALPRHTANSEHTIGALVKGLGKGRRRAHRGSLIRVDVGVGQRRRAKDVESPALPAKRTSA